MLKIGFSRNKTYDSWDKNWLIGRIIALSFNPEITFGMKNFDGKTAKKPRFLHFYENVDLLMASPKVKIAHVDMFEKVYIPRIPLIISNRPNPSNKYQVFVRRVCYLIFDAFFSLLDR